MVMYDPLTRENPVFILYRVFNTHKDKVAKLEKTANKQAKQFDESKLHNLKRLKP